MTPSELTEVVGVLHAALEHCPLRYISLLTRSRASRALTPMRSIQASMRLLIESSILPNFITLSTLSAFRRAH